MMGTHGGKELKYHTVDTLILDILGMDIPTMEGLESEDCFRSVNIVTDVTYAGTFFFFAIRARSICPGCTAALRLIVQPF
jgi:hypothetical protein